MSDIFKEKKGVKVYIRTYGCQMNERDSEDIGAQFLERGWVITDDETKADIAIVNTCSVREQAEQKAIGKLGRLIWTRNAANPLLPVVGVVGCMAQNRGAGIVKILPEIDFVLGARKTHKVAEVAVAIWEKRIAGEGHPKLLSGLRRSAKTSAAFVDISDDPISHLKIDRHLPNTGKTRVCGYVSIMQGCEMNCSYCIVPKTRGAQRSRPTADIVAESRRLVEGGVKEITLLGQVVNAFARELGIRDGITEFVRLLRELDSIDGLERIRFTSPHPSYFGDDLIDAYAELPKLCEYVHLPMQSGSDKILRAMNRPYKIARFMEIAQKLKSKSRDMSVSTDIIVGYPDETDSDFDATRRAFREAAFDMAFIFKYSPRLGTKSAALPDSVPEEVKEERNQLLLEDLAKQSTDFNERMVGSIQQVLVESPAHRGANMMMGRTRNHRKAIFKGATSDIGRIVDVKILGATTTALESEIV